MDSLGEAEIEQSLQGLAGWGRQRQNGVETIVREIQFQDFAAALAFVNRVGEAAEAANHHPDILLHSWNKVRLQLSTHTAGGLTNADFALAQSIGELL